MRFTHFFVKCWRMAKYERTGILARKERSGVAAAALNCWSSFWKRETAIRWGWAGRGEIETTR